MQIDADQNEPRLVTRQVSPAHCARSSLRSARSLQLVRVDHRDGGTLQVMAELPDGRCDRGLRNGEPCAFAISMSRSDQGAYRLEVSHPASTGRRAPFRYRARDRARSEDRDGRDDGAASAARIIRIENDAVKLKTPKARRRGSRSAKSPDANSRSPMPDRRMLRRDKRAKEQDETRASP
jgi:hypothetical protein